MDTYYRKNCLYLNSHQKTFAIRAFRDAALVAWNSLPLQLTDDLLSPAFFHHHLKTHLLSKSFHHWLSWPVCNCDFSIYSWLDMCCVTNCLILILIILQGKTPPRCLACQYELTVEHILLHWVSITNARDDYFCISLWIVFESLLSFNNWFN